jgi:uncharacterized protein (TIGR04141 family)
VKLNVFKIQKDRVKDLKDRLKYLKLKHIHSATEKGYQCDFYFSEEPAPTKIPWVETYSEFFTEEPTNKIYYACYLWENDKYCFALSYGKAHFYLRQFCDHDFGTEVAKRIANGADVRQKSSKKFAGKKKKEIKSYTKNSKLDIESGESIDYLQASIIDNQKINFGKSGKFGSSVLVVPEIEKDKLPDFFDSLISVMDLAEQFPLPRTTLIDTMTASTKYEQKLVDEIMAADGSTDFASNSHELYGVDFIFSGQEKYKFHWRGTESGYIEELSIEALQKYATENSIPKSELLSVKVEVEKEDNAKSFSKTVRDSLDYIVGDEMVILSQGRWMRFNQDYNDQLDDYIDGIDLEVVENDLVEITPTSEDDFNKSMESRGYSNADKDFSKIKIPKTTLVEAWDLQKDDTVYAVKFGTPQKIGYVCDQSTNTIELFSKKSNIKKLGINFKNYCLWIGLDRDTKITKLSEIKSIIFKQKIESWARKCWEYGIEPKIKISYIKRTAVGN